MTTKIRFNYFDFLLDKTGDVLKSYLDGPEKDPPPWQLCKQFIEKSLAVRNAAAQSQGSVTENELKVFEAQRIWQPLCLSMTLLAHMKWDLDKIQEHFPLHLQQLVMEELLHGYGIPLIPQPENFDINKLSKKTAMVHIIYNRWVVRTITKYEELKEKDIQPIVVIGPPSSIVAAKELKDNQEQIFQKLKGLRHLSLDILEKAMFLESDLLIPLPMPRLVTDTEIIPQNHEHQQHQQQQQQEKEKPSEPNEEKGGEESSTTAPPISSNHDDQEKKNGVVMKVSPLLDVYIEATITDVISKICIDLGCYYFPKEMFGDARRVFQKAYEVLEKAGENDAMVNGFYLACCDLSKEIPPSNLKSKSLYSQLEECKGNNFKNIVSILKEDNIKREISLKQRSTVEKDIFLIARKSLLFDVCSLNFFRCCAEGEVGNLFTFYQALKMAKSDEIDSFLKLFKETYEAMKSNEMKDKLLKGLRLSVRYMTSKHQRQVKKNKFCNKLLNKDEEESPRKKVKEEPLEKPNSQLAYEMEISTGGHFNRDLEKDERMSKLSQLKAQLISCFDSETLKDILYELHEIPPEQSHATAFEILHYKEIFSEIHNFLMHDTVHVFVAKAKQLTLQKKFSRALNMLNICVKVLTSYATKASPGCSVSRVKNILHHELLWTELKLAQHTPENANFAETTRRCKACIQHSNQNPPPQPHIYRAIVAYLMNSKENQFLVDACANFDLNIVDFQQFGYYMSAVICSLQRGIDALRNAANELWDTVLKIVGDSTDNSSEPQPPPPQAITTARGPNEEKEMWALQCFIRREDFIEFILSLTDDTVLSLLLSCLASMLCVIKGDSGVTIKDSYSHLWPSIQESEVQVRSENVLAVLRPFCEYCLRRNGRNITWLRAIADVQLMAGNYGEAMKCYLELGSITSSFFSRTVALSVWDEKVYKNMIKCCEEQRSFTQAIVLSQFMEPVDYENTFRAIQQRSSDDAMDCFYECLWDVNILEYLIYTHEKRGEIEKRKLAVQVMGLPELNTRCSPDILQQAQNVRKTRFLRTLTRIYWR